MTGGIFRGFPWKKSVHECVSPVLSGHTASSAPLTSLASRWHARSLMPPPFWLLTSDHPASSGLHLPSLVPSPPLLSVTSVDTPAQSPFLQPPCPQLLCTSDRHYLSLWSWAFSPFAHLWLPGWVCGHHEPYLTLPPATPSFSPASFICPSSPYPDPNSWSAHIWPSLTVSTLAAFLPALLSMSVSLSLTDSALSVLSPLSGFLTGF